MVENTKLVRTTGRPKPPAAGKGRPKGSVNKVTKQLKEMILGAQDDAGGQRYLVERGTDPKTQGAFLTQLGKVLPTETRLADPDGKPLQVAPVFNVTMSKE